MHPSDSPASAQQHPHRAPAWLHTRPIAAAPAAADSAVHVAPVNAPLRAKFPVDPATTRPQPKRQSAAAAEAGLTHRSSSRPSTASSHRRTGSSASSAFAPAHTIPLSVLAPTFAEETAARITSRLQSSSESPRSSYRLSQDPNQTVAGARAAQTVELLIPGSTLRPTSGFGRVRLKTTGDAVTQSSRPGSAAEAFLQRQEIKQEEAHPKLSTFSPPGSPARSSRSTQRRNDAAASSSATAASARASSPSKLTKSNWWFAYNFSAAPAFRYVNLSATTNVIGRNALVRNDNIQLAFLLSHRDFVNQTVEEWEEDTIEGAVDNEQEEQREPEGELVEYTGRDGTTIRFRKAVDPSAPQQPQQRTKAVLKKQPRPVSSAGFDAAAPSVTLEFQTHLPSLFSLVDDAHYPFDGSACPSAAGLTHTLKIQLEKLAGSSAAPGGGNGGGVLVGDPRLLRFALESLIYSLSHVSVFLRRMEWTLHYFAVSARGPLLVFVGSYNEVHIVVASSARLEGEAHKITPQAVNLQSSPQSRSDDDEARGVQLLSTSNATNPNLGELHTRYAERILSPSVASLPLSHRTGTSRDLRPAYAPRHATPSGWLVHRSKLYVLHLPLDLTFESMKMAATRLAPLPPALGESVTEALRNWEARSVERQRPATAASRATSAASARPASTAPVRPARPSSTRSSLPPNPSSPTRVVGAASFFDANERAAAAAAANAVASSSAYDSLLVRDDADEAENEWDAVESFAMATHTQSTAQMLQDNADGYFGVDDDGKRERPQTATARMQSPSSAGRSRSASPAGRPPRVLGAMAPTVAAALAAQAARSEVGPHAQGITHEISYISEGSVHTAYHDRMRRGARSIEVPRLEEKDEPAFPSSAASVVAQGQPVFVRVGQNALPADQSSRKSSHRGGSARSASSSKRPGSAVNPLKQFRADSTIVPISAAGGVRPASPVLSYFASGEPTDKILSPRSAAAASASGSSKSPRPQSAHTSKVRGASSPTRNVTSSKAEGSTRARPKSAHPSHIGQSGPAATPADAPPSSTLSSSALDDEDDDNSFLKSTVSSSTHSRANLREEDQWIPDPLPPPQPVIPPSQTRPPSLPMNTTPLPSEILLRQLASATSEAAKTLSAQPSAASIDRRSSSPASVTLPAQLVAMANAAASAQTSASSTRPASPVRSQQQDASFSLANDLATGEDTAAAPLPPHPQQQRPQSAFARRISSESKKASSRPPASQRPASAFRASSHANSESTTAEPSRPATARPATASSGYFGNSDSVDFESEPEQRMTTMTSAEEDFTSTQKRMPDPPLTEVDEEAETSFDVAAAQPARAGDEPLPPLSFTSFVLSSDPIAGSPRSGAMIPPSAAVVSIPAGHPLSYNHPMSDADIEAQGEGFLTSSCARAGCRNNLRSTLAIGQQLWKCSWCATAVYCSSGCMTEDWMGGEHQRACLQQQAANREEQKRFEESQPHAVQQGQGWMGVTAAPDAAASDSAPPRLLGGVSLAATISPRRHNLFDRPPSPSGFESLGLSGGGGSGGSGFGDDSLGLTSGQIRAMQNQDAQFEEAAWEREYAFGHLQPASRRELVAAQEAKEAEARAVLNAPESLSAAMASASAFPPQPVFNISTRARATSARSRLRPTVNDMLRASSTTGGVVVVPDATTAQAVDPYASQHAVLSPRLADNQLETQRAYALMADEIRVAEGFKSPHAPSKASATAAAAQQYRSSQQQQQQLQKLEPAQPQDPSWMLHRYASRVSSAHTSRAQVMEGLASHGARIPAPGDHAAFAGGSDARRSLGGFLVGSGAMHTRTGGGGVQALPTESIIPAPMHYLPLAPATMLYAKTRQSKLTRPQSAKPTASAASLRAQQQQQHRRAPSGGSVTGAFSKGLAPKYFPSSHLDIYMRLAQAQAADREPSPLHHPRSTQPLPVYAAQTAIPTVDLQRAMSATRPKSARLASDGRSAMAQ